MRHLPAVLSLLPLALCGCAEKIDYEDPNAVTLVDEYFNDTDMKKFADKMTQSMMASNVFAEDPGPKPVVMVELVTNRTNEHVDIKSLTDKIRTGIVRTGRVEVVDETARQTLPEEYEYHASGNVDPDTARGPGRQIAPDYLLRGDLTSEVHESKNQKTRVTYYKLTLQLTDISKGTLVWTDDDDTKKIRRK